MEIGHENLVDVLDNSGRYFMISKGKNMSNVLVNGVIFSTLKHKDPHRARVYKNASRFFFLRISRQKGVMVPGVPIVDRGNWARESCRRVR